MLYFSMYYKFFICYKSCRNLIYSFLLPILFPHIGVYFIINIDVGFEILLNLVLAKEFFAYLLNAYFIARIGCFNERFFDDWEHELDTHRGLSGIIENVDSILILQLAVMYDSLYWEPGKDRILLRKQQFESKTIGS